MEFWAQIRSLPDTRDFDDAASIVYVVNTLWLRIPAPQYKGNILPSAKIIPYTVSARILLSMKVILLRLGLLTASVSCLRHILRSRKPSWDTSLRLVPEISGLHDSGGTCTRRIRRTNVVQGVSVYGTDNVLGQSLGMRSFPLQFQRNVQRSY